MKVVPTPVKKGIKWFVKPAVSVKSWLSWDFIKGNSSYVADSARSLTNIEKAEHTETFAEAAARLELSEDDIKSRQRSFLRLAYILGAVALLCLLYTIYLFWQAEIGSGILAFVVTVGACVSAARYHFWYFQVKHRKLGCSLHEWLEAKITENK